ncbi:Glycoside hydrolase family 16 [Dillenia turbinata]|uniref:Xyloglucan endotransglucosylase/hydrolase n=1 Tax=Dillenia turbinata TaxID=194707 RepID=A0AAN8UZK1_9MAGN
MKMMNGQLKFIACVLLLFIHLYDLCYTAEAAFDHQLHTIRFSEGFSHLFGEGNFVPSSDGKGVRLLLDRFSGIYFCSGFISSDLYDHGFFSANIKLPSNYTAGIVVAFYMSNADVFPKTHDELDIEFLGNIKGKAWRFQTNVYGNGSTSRGREERYRLWFDPSKEFHRYSIFWTSTKIMFYVDEVPIREMVRNEEMGGDYPSKPMSLYATIWDASSWATSGGKYKVNYKYAPFISEFNDLVLHGCTVDPIEQLPTPSCFEKTSQLESATYATITPRRRRAMKKFRQKYMYYSYCYDTLRYPIPPPECEIDPSVRNKLMENGRLRFTRRHHSRPRVAGQISGNIHYENQYED